MPWKNFSCQYCIVAASHKDPQVRKALCPHENPAGPSCKTEMTSKSRVAEHFWSAPMQETIWNHDSKLPAAQAYQLFTFQVKYLCGTPDVCSEQSSITLTVPVSECKFYLSAALKASKKRNRQAAPFCLCSRANTFQNSEYQSHANTTSALCFVSPQPPRLEAWSIVQNLRCAQMPSWTLGCCTADPAGIANIRPVDRLR